MNRIAIKKLILLNRTRLLHCYHQRQGAQIREQLAERCKLASALSISRRINKQDGIVNTAYVEMC